MKTEVEMATANTEESLHLVVADELTNITGTLWDPCLSKDWEKEKPSPQCILRIKRYRTYSLTRIESLVSRLGCNRFSFLRIKTVPLQLVIRVFARGI